MLIRKPQRKKPEKSVVDMAIAAVEGNPNPLDMDMKDVDPSPASLDLPEEEHQETCSRCGRPAVEWCAACGSPLCRDCISRARKLANPAG